MTRTTSSITDGIFQHEQMRVKDAGLAGAEALGELALDFLKLFAGLDEGLLEAVQFGGDFRLGQVAFLDGVPRFVEDENFSATNARGYRDAPEDFSPVCNRSAMPQD
jgi:hypothetical protein